MSIENENLPLQLLSFMLQLILHSILVAFIFCIVGQVMFKLSQYVERKGTNLNAVEEKSINLSYFIPIVFRYLFKIDNYLNYIFIYSTYHSNILLTSISNPLCLIPFGKSMWLNNLVDDKFVKNHVLTIVLMKNIVQ